ncbi:beta-glucosidase BglX [Flammeovirga yaeyamensis]|uniref:beta-glucosidase n=2 Tax=Flammeovirga yaeyamensis TaxID=367791 RepID=A0AAX1NBY7_9BACT|nr:beta-glucosidase BglX [Flammeovirga yaeyamensis]
MTVSSYSFGQNLVNKETEKKIDELLSKMTIEEKVGQTVQYSSLWELTGPMPNGESEKVLYEKIVSGKVGSLINITGTEAVRKAQELAINESRLGIPLIFGYDVIHGFKTMFPIPLAEASSFDPEVAKRSAEVAAEEAAAAGLNWTFAPMVDISRDARWGRVMEGAGEDTYLGAKFAYARVKGFQGDDLSSRKTVAATAKHFAAYGFSESGRDYNAVDISHSTLHNVVLPPFKACVDAGVATFMNSFNTIGGEPSTKNSYLQRDLLKGEWEFDGFIVSDWNSIGELQYQGVAGSPAEAAQQAIVAGSDMDMEGNCYSTSLGDLINQKKVNEELLDEAVRRILRVKFALGLFDDPFKYCDAAYEKETVYAEKFRKDALNAALKSIVLLKNEDQILPLNAQLDQVMLTGALAIDKDSPIGNWRAQAIPKSAVSLLEGMKEVQNNLTYVQGPDYVRNDSLTFLSLLDINETDRTGIKEAVKAAKKAKVVVIAMGENCFQSGEARSQSEIGFKGLQLELFEEIYKVNKNIVVVLMNGRPLDLTPIQDKAKAIVETWFLGTESGNAIAQVLYGEYNPSGKLPVSMPRGIGQLPIYYNKTNTGRPTNEDVIFTSRYTDIKSSPLYPFGYGLSYTTYDYKDLKLSSSKMIEEGNLEVSVKVTNTGKVAGEEIVQLYIRDKVASLARPLKELKRFEKITLKPEESKTIKFTLTKEDLAFYTSNNLWETEDGVFDIWVGPHSDEGLHATFEYVSNNVNQ